jgi:hypothetical protein
MVTLGQLIDIQGEIYEIQATLRVSPYKPLPSEMSDEIKKHYKADKLFKKDNLLYLVNEVTIVEPEYD